MYRGRMAPGRPGKWGGKGGSGKGGKGDRDPYQYNQKVDTALTSILTLVIEKYSRFSNELLDLSDLKAVQEVAKHSPDLNTPSWSKVLVTCINENCPTLKALTLDRNSISNLHHLAASLEGLQLDSLSLQGNNISEILELKQLRPLKLKHILLAGNPLYKGDQEMLLRALMKALPSLERVDGVALERKSHMDFMPVAGGGIDTNNQLHLAIIQFMEQYYSAVQNIGSGATVENLMEMYDPGATMTVSAHSTFSIGLQPEGQAWIKRLRGANHNIFRVGSGGAHRTVHVGKLNVGNCLKWLHSVPMTFTGEHFQRHTDIIQLPAPLLQASEIMGTMVTVITHGSVVFTVKHNQKAQQPQTYRRFFDRTWVLSSSPTGAPVILSDSLHFREQRGTTNPCIRPTSRVGTRPYYGLHLKNEDDKVIMLAQSTGLKLDIARSCLECAEAGPWNLEKAQALVQQKMATNALAPQHFDNIQDPQVLMCMVFSQRTRLTPEMAKLCLEAPQVQFDLWKGWLLFIEKEPTLGPEHFVNVN